MEAKIGLKLVHVVAQFSHFTELSVACLVFLGIAFSFLILIRYQRHSQSKREAANLKIRLA